MQTLEKRNTNRPVPQSTRRPAPQVENRRQLVGAVAIASALEGAIVGLLGAVLFLVPNPGQPGAFLEAVLPTTALVAVIFALFSVGKHLWRAHV